MKLPIPPNPQRISSLSPSLYEAARRCKARASWLAFGRRDSLPENPFALLGISFHQVISAANKGQLPVGDEGLDNAARTLFDETAQKLFDETHQMFKVKYGVKERLPYYYLRRESAVMLARTLQPEDEGKRKSPLAANVSIEFRSAVEQPLSSRDKLLFGRPDLIDISRGEVVDYKTRQELLEGSDEPSEQEVRQLHLYAYLANENGIQIRRGAIILPNGKRLPIEISRKDMNEEAEAAKSALEEYNRSVANGKSFEDIAEPSPENCRFCPCIAFCEPFWNSVENTWMESVGCHVEGRVKAVSKSNVYGTKLITMHLDNASGTLDQDLEIVLEQVPDKWILMESEDSIAEGTFLRVIHGRPTITEKQFIIKADRTSTEIWTVAE